MFGYVVANKAGLSEQQLARYRAFYCGLCRALRTRFGQLGRMTLTYDMTFLVMLLSSLYEPETHTGANRCVPHPKTPQHWLQNEFTEYAADLNLALAYHNLLDDWQDDKNLAAHAAAALLRPQYDRVRARLPRQCSATEQTLCALHQTETLTPLPADMAADAFGALMGALFACREDRWADGLRRMGAALGRFIYMMDAYLDLPEDERRGRPNPLAPLRAAPEYEAQCKALFTLHLGECALEFEKLPLVEDADILRNILYSGVWTRYEAQKQKKLRLQGKEPNRT